MFRRLLGRLTLFAALALSALHADAALASRRVALIIGNAKYEHAGLLANTLNDAHAMATLFERAKFDVVEEHDDLSVVEMKRVVRDFTATARNADISVIYYSGHGIEAAGVNYLIPVDARLANAYDVEDETLPLDRLVWATSNVKTLSLIILDACRENPFLRSGADGPATRGVEGHLIGQQATAANTLIAYAARAGSLSYDGTDRNSPFTTALVKFLGEPGVDIRIALGRVRDDVLAATGHRQEPFVYGSLGGETVSLTPADAPVGNPMAGTAADYAMAERVGSPEAWRAFIDAHREGGFYVDLARAQMNRTAPSTQTLALTPPTPPKPIAAPPTPVAALPTPVAAPTRIATAPAPSAKPDAPPPGADAGCMAEGARLAALRNDPTAAAISAFAAEMTCPALRPQLNRLMESAGVAAPPSPLAMAEPVARNPAPEGCEGEGRALERLRAEPDAAQARALYDRLTCAKLQPQLRRIMESLGIDPPPAQLARAPTTAAGEAEVCAKETSALTQLRLNPDRHATAAFAGSMRCGALKAQVARLLESLGD